MPERLTKHPDITLDGLRSAGARYGEGAAQQVLVSCPRERFCKPPSGEICVYGWPDALRMTQISRADWKALAQTSRAESQPAGSWVLGEPLLLGGSGLLIGVAIGLAVSRLARERP